MAGVGKTTLALAAAHELGVRFLKARMLWVVMVAT